MMGQIRPNIVNIHSATKSNTQRSPESGSQVLLRVINPNFLVLASCGEKVATRGHGEDRLGSIRHRLDRREVLQTSKKGRGTPPKNEDFG
jgi:hypothetical protein